MLTLGDIVSLQFTTATLYYQISEDMQVCSYMAIYNGETIITSVS